MTDTEQKQEDSPIEDVAEDDDRLPVVTEDPAEEIPEGHVSRTLTWGEFMTALSVAVGRLTNLYVDPATNMKIAPLFDAFSPKERELQRQVKLMVERINDDYPEIEPLPKPKNAEDATSEDRAEHSRKKARRTVEIEIRTAKIAAAVAKEQAELNDQEITITMKPITLQFINLEKAFDFERKKEEKISTAKQPYNAKVLTGAHISALKPFVEFV